MPQENDLIRYNVNQRGRAHRGQDRHFDCRALAALINSPEVQERVRNRDMVGYYGHWQRMKFGMNPPETVIVDGRNVNIEPAIVTTYLRADNDGNIEHRTEFLDTASGKVAARLNKSRTGGFSSAINAVPRAGLHVPNEFGGFDYTTNRTYLFDSAAAPADGSIFDFVMQDAMRSTGHMAALYDGLRGDHEMALQTIQKLMEENEELLSAMASGRSTAILDGVGEFIAPRMSSTRAADHFTRTAAMFRHADLAGLESLPDAPAESRGDMVLDQVAQHYGMDK
jgi:hypothetical protein